MNAPIKTPIITAPKISKTSRKSLLGWSDVLRAIQTSQSREFLLSCFKSSGFSPVNLEGNNFEAYAALCDAMTRTEDMLEFSRKQALKSDLERLTPLRRELETLLFP